MPYIDDADRAALEPRLEKSATTSGELNFQLTIVVLDYLAANGKSYGTMNDIVGALDNAKDEFRRRIQHPYEDRKREINGDVFYA